MYPYAPERVRRAIWGVTLVRSLAPAGSILGLLPNELLFEIFQWL